ncbi:MAG: hypothetical protein QM572_12040 [Nocardioides sp.]|uniref:hypothetical protein n=1 Tax=Nocardioides sp. TaxID=35761 RepID=UPI0039E58257
MSTPDFATAEGLRALLFDLAYGDPNAWQSSPEATDLMTYAMEKYASLAHKYGLEPTDAAAAAFEVMQNRATRIAEDPWAVITHAVELTLIYESRAEGLLCSTDRARKTTGLDYHDAERFSDRESEITDYDPAFHVHALMADPYDPTEKQPDGEPTNAFFALADAVKFFEELGWRRRDAELGLDYIAARLARCGDPRTAYVSLRRDGNGPGWLDVDQNGWLTMLRTLLGDPRKDYEGTGRGRGVLLRLCTGDVLNDLFQDDALANAIQAIAPVAPASPPTTQADQSHV